MGPATAIERATTGIVSVGYQGKAVDELARDLAGLEVSILADIRLTPVSRRVGFSRNSLAAAAASFGIHYQHLRALGNPKENRAAFSDPEQVENGRARFREFLCTPEAAHALDELTELVRAERVAVLCFEERQEECHRHVVITEVLTRVDVEVLRL